MATLLIAAGSLMILAILAAVLAETVVDWLPPPRALREETVWLVRSGAVRRVDRRRCT